MGNFATHKMYPLDGETSVVRKIVENLLFSENTPQ